MEIKEGIYDIPKGCRAMVVKGQVKVFPRIRAANLYERGVYRCKDCEHYVIGQTKINQIHYGYICELRPKENYNKRFPEQQLFFTALKYGFPCEKFKLRETCP